MLRSGFIEHLGAEHLLPSLEDALDCAGRPRTQETG
jgi:hypothetical protein